MLFSFSLLDDDEIKEMEMELLLMNQT